jgi:hypothetical protein
MIQMCAWCKDKIRDLGGETGISDGICAGCRKEYFPETLLSVREIAQAILNQTFPMIVLFVVFFVFAGMPCFAADPSILPDKPQPTAKVHSEDREFRIEAGALGASWTADAVSTEKSFAASPHRSESGLLFRGSRNAAEISGAWAAVDIGAVVVSYEWKNHVRNRFLHPLWRVPMAIGIIGHSESAIHNSTQGMPQIYQPSPAAVTNGGLGTRLHLGATR